ncbi:signal peptidase II [Mesorhizobium qingshengii]|uniref:Lipoprotein signal peptidase n=1 Tax=Mesorhizobium qingshengii TaxID=1165689 RepID=A0ABT4R3S2_9HYPH|nr:signal peptidase II [Mesorhizobium qingshengii]MCZ8548203.1 signal peptidase II [Mesorhizobium qingshengii]
MRNESKRDVAAGRLRPGKTLAAIVSVAAFVLDLGTKSWVRASLPSPDGLDPLPFLALRPRYNEGTTFGLLSGGTTSSLTVLVTVTVLAVVGLWWWVARAQGPRVILGAGLMAAGALGNLVDRLSIGMVTDFIGLHVGGWYSVIFNLADIWVVLGSILVFFGSRGIHKKGPDEA